MRKTCIHGVSLSRHCKKCKASITQKEKDTIKRVADTFNEMFAGK